MEIRNVSDLKLSEINEETLLDECITMGDDLGVDTNQGSIYRDAADGHILRAAKFFNDLAMVYDIISINSCTGDVLDERLKERGMQRNPPEDTSAVYYVEFVGAEPQEGALVSCDDHFFITEKLGERWAIRSQETGTEMNTLVPGLPVIPETDVDSLVSATLKELAIPAVDTESDASARERFLEKISGPAESGNKTQIKTWCEEIEGVGCARVIPLWAGEGTVQGIIISSNGTAPSEALVELVQETLDPDAEGMGEGLTTIGCHFTATAATEVEINVTVGVTKKAESSYGDIQDAISAAVTMYLKELSLNSATDAISVRYNSIGALIANIPDVVDYDDLLINGQALNVSCTVYQIPVIGEVVVNGSV